MSYSADLGGLVMTTPDDLKQLNVIAYANKIHEILAGTPMAEAQSALTLAVVAMIVLSHETAEERTRAIMGHANQVKNWLDREDIVAWLKSGVVPVQVGHA